MFTLLACVHKQVPGCTVTVAIVILCLPAAADFYIVVSQGVVTVAVALEMQAACVGRDQHLCCLPFPLRHQHVCAFIDYYSHAHCNIDFETVIKTNYSFYMKLKAMSFHILSHHCTIL